MTAPLTPADCDLRDFAFMPVDVRRLLTSETWITGTGDERAAAMSLWLESWHQVPAASLPDNDRMLAHLSQCPTWKKVREFVLRGWVKADDGRLYHPVVAEKALEAWLEKLAQRISGAEGNAKRWGMVFDRGAMEAAMHDARQRLVAINPQSRALSRKRTAGLPKASPPDPKPIALRSHPDPDPTRNPSPDGVGSRSQETETGTGTVKNHSGPDGPGVPPPKPAAVKAVVDPVKDELWRLGRGVLEGQGMSRDAAGTFLGKLVKDHGQKRVLDVVREAVRDPKADPKSWLVAACQQRETEGKQSALERRNASVAENWLPPEVRDATV